MTILLTGATGLIGRQVAKQHIGKSGVVLVAPVRLGQNSAAYTSLRNAGITLEAGSFHDRTFMAGLLKKYAVTHVVHLAAVRGAGSSSLAYRAINIEATRMLLEESLRSGVQRFVYCSSVGVWGTAPRKVPPDENTEYAGDTLYHSSKIEAEKAVVNSRASGLRAIIVRPTITYGAGDVGFPAILVKLVRKRLLLLARPDIRIHLVSAQAVADCIFRIVQSEETPDNLYVVLDQEPVMLGRLADCVHRHFYDRPYPSYMTAPRAAFGTAARIFDLMGSDVWKARMKLISQDWFYKPLGSYAKICYRPPDTIKEFGRYLEAEWPSDSR